MKRNRLIILSAAAALLALVLSGHAQSNNAIIRGTVTDKDGAVVSRANVRVTNAITGYSQETATDAQGAYRLIDVPSGGYRLTIESAGFESSIRDVTVRSNLAQQIDVQLGVAPVRQEVTVSASGDLLEPDKTAPTTVVDRNRILRFPTAQPSRSAEEIVTTAPGWTQDANGRIHARGIEYQVQYSIDGIPEEARIFSPGGEEGSAGDEDKGAPIRPSREWQVNGGFQQQLGRFLRLDTDFYYRRFKDSADVTNFLNTGIIFPVSLARNRSKGVETRLDLARVGGLSGFVSYTNLHLYAFAPITGGLFLGEAIDLRERAGQRVHNEEDQRNTVVFQFMYERLPAKFGRLSGDATTAVTRSRQSLEKIKASSQWSFRKRFWIG